MDRLFIWFFKYYSNPVSHGANALKLENEVVSEINEPRESIDEVNKNIMKSY